jgi:chromosomal replication initiation ATPase DnaA
MTNLERESIKRFLFEKFGSDRIFNLLEQYISDVINNQLKLDWEKIDYLVNEYFDEQIKEDSRRHPTVWRRQLTMYFIRQIPGEKQKHKYSLENIGRLPIFMKNHATVIHSLKSVEELIGWNKQYRKDFEAIKQLLNYGGQNDCAK